MSETEASDTIQPRMCLRYYRTAKRKKEGYFWAVLILFALITFFCVNNYYLLQSYLELKNHLSSAYKVIETVRTVKEDRDKSNEHLESMISELSDENSLLTEEIKQLADMNNLLQAGYEKVSRGSSEISEQLEELKKQFNELKKQKQELEKDNIALQNTVKMAASVGIKPQNYTEFDILDDKNGLNRGEYIGKFLGTAYTPSADECGNNMGITKSGKPVVPGVTIAVDTEYWPLGTVFYIKGLGYTMAMDTGSAVKGKYRFDFSVLDKEFAKKLGSRKWEVYLVKLGNGKVDNLKICQAVY